MAVGKGGPRDTQETPKRQPKDSQETPKGRPRLVREQRVAVPVRACLHKVAECGHAGRRDARGVILDQPPLAGSA